MQTSEISEEQHIASFLFEVFLPLYYSHILKSLFLDRYLKQVLISSRKLHKYTTKKLMGETIKSSA